VTENLLITRQEDVISELKCYKEAGGTTLCDVTPIGMRYNEWREGKGKWWKLCFIFRCNSELLPEISMKSGVNIILGTAYYVDAFIPGEVKNWTIKQVYWPSISFFCVNLL
jgi:predicted metal-dependent phosphotriesterase family hydrolase